MENPDVPRPLRTDAQLRRVALLDAAASAREGQSAVRAPRQGTRLELLEEQIDDCLSLAKHIDREGLSHVISLLRSARNAVVWMTGQ